VCQWQGVAALWPFSRTKFAMDWLATVDPWLILILITALALPELFHLVSSEIGAKEKRPRGQAGALAGILAAILYVGLRAELHANVCAQLQNRTYGGELPRKTGAFADSVSLTTWHGVVETEGALHRITIHVGSATQVMTTASGENLFKPEQTRNLRAAEASEPAKRFLEVAQFPRATVQKVAAGGEEVELRDLRDGAAGELRRAIAVVVDFDANGKMVSQEVVWGNRTDLR